MWCGVVQSSWIDFFWYCTLTTEPNITLHKHLFLSFLFCFLIIAPNITLHRHLFGVPPPPDIETFNDPAGRKAFFESFYDSVCFSPFFNVNLSLSLSLSLSFSLSLSLPISSPLSLSLSHSLSLSLTHSLSHSFCHIVHSASFEWFRERTALNVSLEENRSLLKNKITEAKTLGERVNQSR